MARIQSEGYCILRRGKKATVAKREDLRLWKHLQGEDRSLGGRADCSPSLRRISGGDDRREKLAAPCRTDIRRSHRRKSTNDPRLSCLSEISGPRGTLRRRALFRRIQGR